MDKEQLQLSAKLAEKIARVMEGVEYLQKDMKVEYGRTKYRAVSESMVTTAVRKELIANRMVILPMGVEHKLIEREHENGVSRLSEVVTTYRIVDVETGYSEVLQSLGSGVDSQDKSTGKALTYAYKYLLLRLFGIPTGEDPDQQASDEHTANQGKPKNSTKQVTQEVDKELMGKLESQYNKLLQNDLIKDDERKNLVISGKTMTVQRLKHGIDYIQQLIKMRSNDE